MTETEIKTVVNLTIDELINRKLLNLDNYQTMLRAVEVNLYNFFDNKNNDVSHALISLIDDSYIEIIFLQYRDSKTLEWIAEYYHKDISTIKRNKKRLIQELYKLI